MSATAPRKLTPARPAVNVTPEEAADKFIRGKSAHQLLAFLATREDVPAPLRAICAADGRRLAARVSAREEAALASIA